MATNDIKFHVHVVNSVKGGSGKSTFSLLLADHFVRNHEEAYVIDLDLCGTSWYSDFAGCWEEKEPVFISEIMYTPFTRGFSFNAWSHLKVNNPGATEPGFGSRKINVGIAAKDQADQLCDMPEVELLEHTTYHLIRDVMLWQQNSKEILEKAYNLVIQSHMAELLLEKTNVKLRDQYELEKVSPKVPYQEIWKNVANKLEEMKKPLHGSKLKLQNILITNPHHNLSMNRDYKDATKELKKLIHNHIYNLHSLLQLMTEMRTNSQKTIRDFNFSDSIPATPSADSLFSKIKRTIKDIWDIDYSELEKDSEVQRLKSIRDAVASPVTHFILDLPPSHDTTVEQICHRLLFDNNSPLNKDKDFRGKFKVSFYMMTPVDQLSAYEKNQAYIRSLFFINRRYSSTIKEFLRDGHLKICFVFIDNHGWALNTSLDLKEKVASLAHKPIPEIEGVSGVALPFMSFQFKQTRNIFDFDSRNATEQELNLNGFNSTDIATIVKETT